MSEIRFDNRVAIVTGAGGGLGRAHALLLASRGAKVVVNDLGVDPKGEGKTSAMADAVVQEIRAAGGEAVADYNSVDSWAGGEAIVKTALEAFGQVDVLVNNAGILRDRTIAKMSDEEYRRVIEIHLNGSFYVTRAAFPHMRERNYGRVLFTSSGAGLWGNFGQANYTPAKLGVIGLMHVVKIEGQKHNIRANTIAPIAASRLLGTILTDKVMKALDPNYVSAIACYLVSENCPANGEIYACGGGVYARAAMFESPGINVPEGEVPSMEAIRERFGEIRDMTGAREYFNSREHLKAMLGDGLEF